MIKVRFAWVLKFLKKAYYSNNPSDYIKCHLEENTPNCLKHITRDAIFLKVSTVLTESTKYTKKPAYMLKFYSL